MRDADRLLAGLVRRDSGWTALLAVAALASAGAELVLPLLLGATLDGAIGGEVAPRLFAGCALVVAVVILGEVTADLAAGISRVRVTASLRHRLIRHLLSTGPRSGLPEGDLVARITGNADEAGHAPPAVVMALTSLVPTAGSMVALFLIDPWLGAVFLSGSLVTLILLRAFVRDATDLIEAYQRAQGGIAGALLEALGGLRTIAAAGTRRLESARVLRGLPALHGHGLAMWRKQANISVRMAALGPLTEIAVLATAGLLLSAGRITAGDLVAASRYAVLGGGLGAVVGLLNRLARARAAATRAAEVLALPDHVRQALPPGLRPDGSRSPRLPQCPL
ncbi:ABC transporter transmembrane domain-containing protein [Nonomuraea sp. NBC_01738]|uniref:ABC transporter transmembrane domain-containing protein n=1 Tax=Nonomuraea sp. NBC_01738 TaxID=2976003 RepID=UPI002E0F0206|nr:ABC transporter transmembrane domain-containing protein [Nonomuraea sp. NBC_01738]